MVRSSCDGTKFGHDKATATASCLCAHAHICTRIKVDISFHGIFVMVSLQMHKI